MPRKQQTASTFPVACFAPPLDDAKLARYGELAEATDGPVRDAIKMLLAAVLAWWDLPESKQRGDRWTILHRDDPSKPRERKEFEIKPLEEAHVKALWDLVPWDHELRALTGYRDSESQQYVAGLFDSLPPGELRDAAYHLAWYCEQLMLDREPPTQDLLR